MGDDYREGYLAGIKAAAECFDTHDEGFGDYCDTGADMEWGCRSKCVEHGKERARKLYKKITNSNAEAAESRPKLHKE